MREHNYSIDILKFFAAILITNSHMEILYHPYEQLATGGAIGDVLFFFCSGFTLFLGKMDRFDNWYKKRINRIYPSVFAWALLSSVFFDLHLDAKTQWLNGGGWFVSCIMIYYVILFFVRKYMINKLTLVFLISSIIILIWYLFEDKSTMFMYGATYFKWGHYFLFMLLGAIIGNSNKKLNFNIKSDMLILLISIFFFYGIQVFAGKYSIISYLQIVSLVPLLLITYYTYKISNSVFFLKLAKSKFWGRIIEIISALTLEVYLVQYVLFTDKFNFIFPLNLLIMFIMIVIVAYFLKMLSRIFSQIFSDYPFNWESVYKI